MKLIKDGNIGTYGTTNYFILPKIYDVNNDDILIQILALIREFNMHFENMKHQTIHIFTAFDWKNLIEIMEKLTPNQFTLLYDNILDEYEELRHFHAVQMFLLKIATFNILSFIKNNKIILHCNIDKKILKNISPKKYILNCFECVDPEIKEDFRKYMILFSKIRLEGHPYLYGDYTLFKPNKNTSIKVGFKYRDEKIIPDVIINGKSLEDRK